MQQIENPGQGSGGKQSYVAQLIFRIHCSGISEEQYEEQWRLLFADDATEALAEARLLGQEDESIFADRQGRMIHWQLVAVKDLQPVDLKPGALLASVVREVEPVAGPLWAQ